MHTLKSLNTRQSQARGPLLGELPAGAPYNGLLSPPVAAASCSHTAWHQGQEEGCAGDITGRCFQQTKGLQLHPCISQARVLFCNKALNNKPLVSIVDSCSPNLSQILLVACPVLRQISEPHLELLIEQSSKLWPKSRRILLFQRHTGIYRADGGRHTVEQACGTLIEAEVRLTKGS